MLLNPSPRPPSLYEGRGSGGGDWDVLDEYSRADDEYIYALVEYSGKLDETITVLNKYSRAENKGCHALDEYRGAFDQCNRNLILPRRK